MWKIIIFLFILYGVPVVFLIHKRNDIAKYPAKYLKEMKGYDQYLSSDWYWPPSKPYSRLDKPGKARPTFSWLTLLLIPFTMFLPLICQEMYRPSGSIGFMVNSPVIILLSIPCHAALSVLVPYYLCLYSSNPQNISISIFTMGKKYLKYKYFRRDKIWQEWTTGMIALLLLSLILQLLCLVPFGYIIDDELTYVSLRGEMNFALDNKEMIVKDYDSAGNLQHFYLYNEQGDVFDAFSRDYVFVYTRGDSFIAYITSFG